jgi:hypothetical protein
MEADELDTSVALGRGPANECTSVPGNLFLSRSPLQKPALHLRACIRATQPLTYMLHRALASPEQNTTPPGRGSCSVDDAVVQE